MENFLFVIIHAILWAFMEVEIEGTRGWMYDSHTQCSGIFAFTWYHIVMNILTILTIAHVNHYRNLLWTTYQILTWFIVEDVTWFVINGINYRTAPWQTDLAALMSTALPFVLLYVYRNVYRKTKERFQMSTTSPIPLALVVQVAVSTYMWSSFGTDFNGNTTYTPRNDYCK
jgi:hypothetical protein